MKLNFKVSPDNTLRHDAEWLTNVFAGSQAAEVHHRRRAFRDGRPLPLAPDPQPVTNIDSEDWGSQGEDLGGERMGCCSAEAHLLW